MANDGAKVTIDSKCLSDDNSTYTDCAYPVAVVVGAPGDQEPNPKTWCVVKKMAARCAGLAYSKLSLTISHLLPPLHPLCSKEEWNLKCSGNYGYAHLEVFNATHTYFRWDTTSANGDPADWFDEFWVVKSAAA
jgi:hypothetical protein